MSEISQLASLLGGPPRMPQEIEIAYALYNNELRYAVIEAGFVGDDEDSRCVLNYVSVMRQINDAFQGEVGKLKVSRLISEPCQKFLAAGDEFLSSVEHIAVIRCQALGTNIDEITESIEKPDVIKRYEGDSPESPVHGHDVAGLGGPIMPGGNAA